MVNRQICKAVVLFVLILQLIFPLFPAVANIHQLAGVADKSTAGIQDVDITVSVDWDPAKVTGTEADPRGLTKAEFQTVMDSYAQSVFAMTNGLHRIRNVYVFPNKGYWDMADIRYISKEAGRSNANISSWKKKEGVITMYVYDNYNKDDGTYTRDSSPGPVLAHECGHYVYGIYDEYKEAGGKTRADLKKENKLWMPAGDDDGTQPSIMNNHVTYPNWFSVESAYNTAALKNTAQYRMFEKSIWGTLAADPNTDHANARDYQRTRFDAFKGVSVTKATDLKAKQTGALAGDNTAPKIVWMDTTAYHIVVLDNNVTAASWAQSRKSGATTVRAATVGNWVNVLAGDRIAIDRTKLTAVNKSTLINQISSLAQGTPVSVDKSLQTALAQANKYRSETGTDATYTVCLVTSGNPLVPFSMIKAFNDAKAMLIVTSITGSKAESTWEWITVTDLSDILGGRIFLTSSAQKAESQVSRDINLIEGDNTADIAAEFYPGLLAAGDSQTMTFNVGPRDNTVAVSMFADEEDWEKVLPSLTDPAGKVLLEGSLAAGVTLEKDQYTGLWLFSIDTSLYSGAQGKWSAKMTALTPTVEPFAMTASADSDLAFRIEVRESPLYGYVAMASLSADRPILNARVTANIYNMDGGVLEALTLKDDGLNGDVRAGDGIYSARIRTSPGDEEYGIVAWADDNNGLAVESDRNMIFVSNSYINETSTGAFQRTDETAFMMTLNGGSGSGRCFIAEAAYGSYLDPHVGALRHFRDRYLLPFGPGRMLVRFYYAHSPDWAAFIRQHEAARSIARGVLTPIVYSVQYPFLPAAVVLIGFGFIKRKRWITAFNNFFRLYW